MKFYILRVRGSRNLSLDQWWRTHREGAPTPHPEPTYASQRASSAAKPQCWGFSQRQQATCEVLRAGCLRAQHRPQAASVALEEAGCPDSGHRPRRVTDKWLWRQRPLLSAEGAHAQGCLLGSVCVTAPWGSWSFDGRVFSMFSGIAVFPFEMLTFS